MSRIGKVPVSVPDKVEVTIKLPLITVKGPKGTLSHKLNDKVTLLQEGKVLTVKPKSEDKESMSQWGTARTIISNMVTGVSTGFVKSLEFNGVGYKASVAGNVLQLK